jgi:hypothetical protein
MCFGGQADDCAGLVEAARLRGVPLSAHMIDEAAAASAYERKLCLVRPDGHVAWRGDQAPNAPERLIDIVRGDAAG